VASVLPLDLEAVSVETEVHVSGRDTTVRGGCDDGDYAGALHAPKRRDGGLTVGDFGSAS
jgi:hypothetical protein